MYLIQLTSSILNIKEKMNNNVFSFRNVTYEEILNKMSNLDTSMPTHSENIPFKIIKDRAGFWQFYLTKF